MSDEKNIQLNDEELEAVSGGSAVPEKTFYVGNGEKATRTLEMNKGGRKAKSLVAITTDKGKTKAAGQSGDPFFKANC